MSKKIYIVFYEGKIHKIFDTQENANSYIKDKAPDEFDFYANYTNFGPSDAEIEYEKYMSEEFVIDEYIDWRNNV